MSGREAAERLRRVRNGEATLAVYFPNVTAEWMQDNRMFSRRLIEATQLHHQDALTVADAYLAELDETPVDREFADSLKPTHTAGNCVEWWNLSNVLELKLCTLGMLERWELRFNGETIIEKPTRGQVLTLLRAMGET